MTYHAATLGQIRQAVNAFIERLGPDAPIRHRVDHDFLTLWWVQVDFATGQVVTEGPTPSQANAVLVD
ncbi:hypothetical protein [Fimbriiglobus ruber]|uniref:Uncharacterized protein n=1 Tax=Fimbriiglobus ruber TaxID=1908690 RepID=A0A225D6Z8_9BACT|nr:hypothetical protein [Fimbriiglobus ruber]OWK34328.1 hypothetical protein FRUB_10299 [Fimbriiglobus ruber]